VAINSEHLVARWSVVRCDKVILSLSVIPDTVISARTCITADIPASSLRGNDMEG
jgi:hypothetical protein